MRTITISPYAKITSDFFRVLLHNTERSLQSCLRLTSCTRLSDYLPDIHFNTWNLRKSLEQWCSPNHAYVTRSVERSNGFQSIWRNQLIRSEARKVIREYHIDQFSESYLNLFIYLSCGSRSAASFSCWLPQRYHVSRLGFYMILWQKVPFRDDWLSPCVQSASAEDEICIKLAIYCQSGHNSEPV